MCCGLCDPSYLGCAIIPPAKLKDHSDWNNEQGASTLPTDQMATSFGLTKCQ